MCQMIAITLYRERITYVPNDSHNIVSVQLLLRERITYVPNDSHNIVSVQLMLRERITYVPNDSHTSLFLCCRQVMGRRVTRILWWMTPVR
jgi:hypothetical protein